MSLPAQVGSAAQAAQRKEVAGLVETVFRLR